MKTINEIHQIMEAQKKLDMLSKPESLTDQEYNYYLNVEILESEIYLMKIDLERKEDELYIMINDPDYFRHNEWI